MGAGYPGRDPEPARQSRRVAPYPLLEGDFLLHFFIQEYALAYESMVQVLTEGRAAAGAGTFALRDGLRTVMPAYATEEVDRGHFHIGANDPNTARDNEVPPQAVQLDAFRIATTPPLGPLLVQRCTPSPAAELALPITHISRKRISRTV